MVAAATRRQHHKAASTAQTKTCYDYEYDATNMHHDRRNSVVMEELTNKQSELSKFLKVDSSKDSGDESNRSMSLTSCVETITSFIRSPRDYAYVLACEPIEVRRERVVMLAEACKLFTQ